MSTLTELVTKFKFEGNSKPLAEFSSQLAKSIGGIKIFAAAASAAAVVMFAWADPILNTVDALGNLSKNLKVPVARIQEYSYAAAQMNSSAEELQSSLSGLSNSAALAANNMGLGRKVFKELGINVRDSNGRLKNSAVLLDEIRQRMNQLNLTTDERSAFAQKLGMSPNLVQLLSATNEEMAAMAATAQKLGVLTEEQVVAAMEYNDAMDTLKYAMQSFRQMLATAVAPALTVLIKSFTNMIMFVRDLIDMIKRLLPVLALAGAAFVAFKIYMLGALNIALLGSFALMRLKAVLLLLVSPMAAIIVGITAFVLIMDDLIVAFKGGDSIIGNFFKNTLNIDLSKTLDQLKMMWDWVVKLTGAISGGFADAWKGIKGVFGGDMGQPAVQSMVTSGGRGRSSNSTDNRQINQKVDIIIKTDDPVRAGQAAGENIQKQLRDANAQVGVGGL